VTKEPPRITIKVTPEQKAVLEKFCKDQEFPPSATAVVHRALKEYLGRRKIVWPESAQEE